MPSIRLLDVKNLKLEEFDESDESQDVPKYLILSHTWGRRDEEISYKDMTTSRRHFTNKKGWMEKGRGFCELAKRYGFGYVWIDTCCINKADKSELDYAIRRMYRWYHKATACYVYLNDVDQKKVRFLATSNVEKSVWFSRGWTLQELLAPENVWFFDQNWDFLGNRRTLAPAIERFTGIPQTTLNGKDPTKFSAIQIFRWALHRVTQRPEDRIYSLFGLLKVNLDTRYGEGETGAFIRLHDELGKMAKRQGNNGRSKVPQIPRTISEESSSNTITSPSSAIEKFVRYHDDLVDQRHDMDARGDNRPPRRYHHFSELPQTHRVSHHYNFNPLPDWAPANVPAVTNRLQSEDSRDSDHKIEGSRQIYTGVPGNALIPYGVNNGGDGTEVSRRPAPTHLSVGLPRPAPAFQDSSTRQWYAREPDPEKRLWTRVESDLVVEEAIQMMGYEYQITDDFKFYYIFAYLPSKDREDLVKLSEAIRRQTRIREIEVERQYFISPSADEWRQRAIEPPPSRSRRSWD